MNSGIARPMGITILALLALIGGVFGLLGGLALIGLGGVAGGVIGGTTGAAVGGFAVLVGLIVLIGAALYLAFAYGAWTLKPWGWALGVIGALWGIVSRLVAVLMSSDIFGNLFSLSTIVSVAVPIAILYYLNTPVVKSAFGRS